jgi:hypothetical protein
VPTRAPFVVSVNPYGFAFDFNFETCETLKPVKP